MRKTLLYLTIAIVLTMALTAGVATAGTITYVFGSHPSAANTPNDAVTSPSGTVLDIGLNPAWYGPLPGSVWIGTAQTGDPSRPGWIEVPNGTVTTYFDQFVLPDWFNVQSATLNVLVDDTANGWMNETQLFTASDIPAVNCAAQAPGCWESTMWTGDITSLVHGGSNLLQVDSIQKWGSSTGVDFSLTVTGTVPEPGTYVMLGAGLVGLGFLRRRAKK